MMYGQFLNLFPKKYRKEIYANIALNYVSHIQYDYTYESMYNIFLKYSKKNINYKWIHGYISRNENYIPEKILTKFKNDFYYQELSLLNEIITKKL